MSFWWLVFYKLENFKIWVRKPLAGFFKSGNSRKPVSYFFVKNVRERDKIVENAEQVMSHSWPPEAAVRYLNTWLPVVAFLTIANGFPSVPTSLNCTNNIVHESPRVSTATGCRVVDCRDNLCTFTPQLPVWTWWLLGGASPRVSTATGFWLWGQLLCTWSLFTPELPVWAWWITRA